MKLAHGILSLATLAVSSPHPSFLVSGFATPRASRAPPSHRLHQSSSSIDNDTSLANLARPTMPSHSPATRLPNQIYQWRGYQIRYQVSGPPDADHTLLLIHGLFVNSDHWRKTLTGLPSLREMEEGGKTCRVYAIDLLGSGWSSKPNREDGMARAINGENGRFVDCDSVCYRETQPQDEQRQLQQQQLSKTTRAKKRLQKIRTKATLNNVPLGTASGGKRMASALELRHPLGSPYNFYTWAEQITDFVHDVIHEDHYQHHHHHRSRSSTPNDSNNDDANAPPPPNPPPKVTLVANSIGTMSSLQSILDEPHLFNGCLIINPNFRELHMAEVPFSRLSMPLVRRIQAFLRTHGRSLYDSLATPSTVKEILKEPYAVVEAIDDELIDVLLTPLLTEGAADVVFDTLSYSAGPLPEQQLGSRFFPAGECPVWVVYGKSDPWTPGRRVEGLRDVGGCHDGGGGGPMTMTMTKKQRNDRYGTNYGGGGRFGGPVERVVGLEGVGHCPHDESPEEVNRLIWEFLDRISTA